jgi:hypothetical protein
LQRGAKFLPIIGGLYIAAMISYAFVWLVDPYNLRAGGIDVKLADHPYIDRVVPLIFYVAANSGTDLVVIGGSTSVNYSTSMLKDAFPEAKKPLNLSFLAPRASDFQIVFDRVKTFTSLKRVILNIEWTYIKDLRGYGIPRDFRYYTHSWFEPVPEFNAEAVLLSANVMRTGVLDLPFWNWTNPNRPNIWLNRRTVAETPASLEKLTRAADISRKYIGEAPLIPCERMPHLADTLLPFVTQMAEQGILVDLLMPPYSLALYTDWNVNAPLSSFFPGNGAPFANFASLRRCVVEMTSGLPNVRVHAFDNDVAITGDLSRYVDSAHILDRETSRQILLGIARGDATLDIDTLGEFDANLRDKIERFRP